MGGALDPIKAAIAALDAAIATVEARIAELKAQRQRLGRTDDLMRRTLQLAGSEPGQRNRRGARAVRRRK